VNEGLLDPKIAAWILDSEQNKDKSLEQLYKEYSCNAVVPYDYTVSLESFSQTFLKVHYSLCLMTKLNELLNQNLKELEIFKEIEMPLVPILAKMEYYGIGFVKDRYKYYEALIRRKLDILEKEAHKLAGKKFRLTNATDVYHVLFVELKIPYPEESTILHSTGKLRRAYYSTKEEVLQSIAHLHPLPNIILEHRKLSHTINNYIDVLPKFAFYDPIVTKMERIHSVCQQTVVPTGRLSFTSPNLQAITHKFQFQFEAPSNRTRNDSNDRSSLGDCSMLSIQKECILVPSSNDTVVTVNIRDSFVSQQEFRILIRDQFDSII
jgi:DNA polymerase I-like protein with 3'-5' exonuclease and polymerase domains